jgi:hypothetical protein
MAWRIDAPVVELYGLTEEKIAFVEGLDHLSTEGNDDTDRGLSVLIDFSGVSGSVSCPTCPKWELTLRAGDGKMPKWRKASRLDRSAQ